MCVIGLRWCCLLFCCWRGRGNKGKWKWSGIEMDILCGLIAISNVF